jgi:hypothetical protein
MATCAACSMPLSAPADHAGGDVNSPFCRFCANADGTVRTGDEIFEGGVQFFMKALGESREMAEKVTRKNMSMLPYWQGKYVAALKGELATDQEFGAAMQKLQAAH